MEDESSAVNVDGTLKDASEIQWFNDADDEEPLPPTPLAAPPSVAAKRPQRATNQNKFNEALRELGLAQGAKKKPTYRGKHRDEEDDSAAPPTKKSRTGTGSRSLEVPASKKVVPVLKKHAAAKGSREIRSSNSAPEKFNSPSHSASPTPEVPTISRRPSTSSLATSVIPPLDSEDEGFEEGQDKLDNAKGQDPTEDGAVDTEEDYEEMRKEDSKWTKRTKHNRTDDVLGVFARGESEDGKRVHICLVCQ